MPVSRGYMQAQYPLLMAPSGWTSEQEGLHAKLTQTGAFSVLRLKFVQEVTRAGLYCRVPLTMTLVLHSHLHSHLPPHVICEARLCLPYNSHSPHSHVVPVPEHLLHDAYFGFFQ